MKDLCVEVRQLQLQDMDWKKKNKKNSGPCGRGRSEQSVCSQDILGHILYGLELNKPHWMDVIHRELQQNMLNFQLLHNGTFIFLSQSYHIFPLRHEKMSSTWTCKMELGAKIWAYFFLNNYGHQLIVFYHPYINIIYVFPYIMYMYVFYI